MTKRKEHINLLHKLWDKGIEYLDETYTTIEELTIEELKAYINK